MKQSRPIILYSSLIAIFVFGLISVLAAGDQSEIEFQVSVAPAFQEDISDGRLLLFLTKEAEPEPRFQARPGLKAIQMFGKNVVGFEQGTKLVIGHDVFGYPVADLSDVPAGEYFVQALFHKYETFNLATGHTVKLPMDRGEGQQWRRAPGNLYSTPQKIFVDPKGSEPIAITLDQVIAEIEPPADTEYIKHVQIQSDLLTEFWGRPMHLGAHVLLPEGFDQHPEARYPLMIFHGHFPADFGGFRTEPPDADLEPDYSE